MRNLLRTVKKGEYFQACLRLFADFPREISPDAMDWRAASRSRSRASVMDWRPSSRSRSRSTFNRNRNPYEHASEMHSQAMLALGTDMPLQEQLLAFTQSSSQDNQWPMSQYVSNELQGGANASTSGPENPPQQEDLVGISSFTSQFSPDHQTRRKSTSLSKNAFEYDQAIRTAAAYDAFASSVPNDQPLHLSGEILPSSLTSQSGPSATLALSPKNLPKLPGISGPGLFDETQENFHPQYGFLPRRVRKTSFDHTVAQGSSAESNSGLLPPPRIGKVRRLYKRNRLLLIFFLGTRSGRGQLTLRQLWCRRMGAMMSLLRWISPCPHRLLYKCQRDLSRIPLSLSAFLVHTKHSLTSMPLARLRQVRLPRSAIQATLIQHLETWDRRICKLFKTCSIKGPWMKLPVLSLVQE